MTQPSAHYAELLQRYLQNELQPEELQDLFDWIRREPAAFEACMRDDALRAIILERANQTAMAPEAADRLKRRLLGNIEGTRLTPVRRVHFLRTAWFKYAAAIVLLFGASAYLWNLYRNSQQVPVVTTRTGPMQDVAAPSSTKATLTLANGQKIFLDSASDGTLAIQGMVNIQKRGDGSIVYDGDVVKGEVAYNTLTVPRGSQIASVILSDGSKVILNAASSLTYPVAFTGKERRVEITGEAYFEVAKDPSRIFYVQCGDYTTQVLGTHFNISAYTDEITGRVTLLEGKVKVTRRNQQHSVTLLPGQQTRFNPDLETIRNVDLESVVAWKEGMFHFDNTNVASIMRQISRWYDVDVEFVDDVRDKHFTGKIGRHEHVSEVLHLLELTDVIHFNIEGKKLKIYQ